jgi:acetyl esterase/lipase
MTYLDAERDHMSVIRRDSRLALHTGDAVHKFSPLFHAVTSLRADAMRFFPNISFFVLPLATLVLLGCLPAHSAEPAQVVPLWKSGAPGFEDRKDEPETAKDWWVANVHNPSLTIYLPEADKANGVGIVICPGGGHRTLVFNAEGTEAAEFLRDLGFACFVLKYRLGREENSPYKIDDHAFADGQRAIRLVRSRAEEFGVDPNRIGLLGFSAGGEVVSMVTFSPSEGEPSASDKVEQASSKVDFQIQVYPGPLGIPHEIKGDLPPAFFVVASDDGATKNILRLIEGYSDAGKPFEAHVYQRGGHGFNMGRRSPLKSVSTWPQRMADWLADNIVAAPPLKP